MPTLKDTTTRTKGTREEETRQEGRLLLPVPAPEDVAGFMTLYQQRYGIALEAAEAHEILGGLMRFLYLTRRRSNEAPLRGEPPG